MKNCIFTRLLSLLLCFMLVCGSFPFAMPRAEAMEPDVFSDSEAAPFPPADGTDEPSPEPLTDSETFTDSEPVSAAQPGLTLSADALDFGAQCVDYAAVQPLTVTVTNNTDDAQTPVPGAAESFAVSALSPAEIPAGGSAVFTVSPEIGLAAGSYEPVLTLTLDDDAYDVALRFTVCAHSYDGGWLHDEAQHWQECALCGAKRGEAAHSFTEAVGQAEGSFFCACGFSSDAALFSLGATAVTPTLQMTNLVVFVRFADDDTDDFNEIPLPSAKPKRTVWTDLKERYNYAVTTASDSAYTNDVDDSFCAYIDAISGGKARVYNLFPQEYLDTDGISKVSYFDLAGTKASYEDNESTLIEEVIAAFNDGTLTLPGGVTLDRRESGVLDNLTIVVQGAPDSGVNSLMRSHKGVAATEDLLGGKTVRTYNMLCGDALISSKASLIAHEFLHSIGLPDLYRYFGDGDPVGVWDIMASEGSFLQYPLSYQRSIWGWVELPEITHSGEYYLTSPLDGGGNQGFILRSPMSESEFFVVEYREKNTNAFLRGFEVKIPESGVIVYRVNTTVENLTNAAGEDYIYVFRDDETGLSDSYSASRLTTGAALTAGEARAPPTFPIPLQIAQSSIPTAATAAL